MVGERIPFLRCEEIEDLQNEQLAHTIRLVVAGHPFFRRVFRERGLTSSDVQTIADLPKLPLLTKQQVAAAPHDFRLDVPSLPPEEKTIHQILYTTGTTSGAPTPLYNTTHDHFACLVIARRVAQVLGLTPDDTIANLYPVGSLPHLTQFAANAYAMVSGARIASAMPGAPYPPFAVTKPIAFAVELIERIRATCLWGMPSYLRRVLMLAQRLGADFSRVRMAAVSGEATTGAMRADLVARLESLGAEAPFVSNRFGFTEMASVMVECSRDGVEGFHLLAPDHFYIEAVDAEGAPVPDGQPGRLAITHLQRRGTVLLRYLTGDIVTLSEQPCPTCGRTCPRVTSPPYRKDHLVKVKGMLVNPHLILAELAAVPEITECQIVLTKEDPEDPLSMDALVVRIAVEASEPEGVRTQVSTLVQRTAAVSPVVELTTPDTIYDPNRHTKAARNRRPEAAASLTCPPQVPETA